jgi:hypothetical protein
MVLKYYRKYRWQCLIAKKMHRFNVVGPTMAMLPSTMRLPFSSSATRFLLLSLVLMLPGIAQAGDWKLTIPLHDGRLEPLDLRRGLESAFNLSPETLQRIPNVKVRINLRALDGWMFIRATNAALGGSFHLKVADDALVVTANPGHLPHNWQQTCDAVERFTQVAAPDATARQAALFGLHLPQEIDSSRPLVVLIHGFHGDDDSCSDLSRLLDAAGYQTARFGYPTERPLGENAQSLTFAMRSLHRQFPGLRVDLITESMGGLLARRYVEGPDYAGGVDRLILVCPPNQGSSWISAGFVLKVIANAQEWKNDPRWSPSWMITEGIGQEAADLRPNSAFLDALNSQPRRSGVRYTIIAGNEPLQYHLEAQALALCDAALAHWAADCWGMPEARAAIENHEYRLLRRIGGSDGPVQLSSARLPGVDDFNVLPADHVELFKASGGNPPAAWPIIQDRLSR